jgi:hypothetical protein
MDQMLDSTTQSLGRFTHMQRNSEAKSGKRRDPLRWKLNSFGKSNRLHLNGRAMRREVEDGKSNALELAFMPERKCFANQNTANVHSPSSLAGRSTKSQLSHTTKEHRMQRRFDRKLTRSPPHNGHA